MVIIYLHGFNSSPASHKACILKEALANVGVECLIPELSPVPFDAVSMAEALIKVHLARDVVLIGSSLGGYYASCLAERFNLRAVMINPAIRPYELLRDYLGINENIYTHARYELDERHLHQLQTMDIERLAHPENYLLLVQTGDELLDSQQAVKKFDQSQKIIIEGGSHGFDGFENVVNDIISFICKN